jgi:hypothetical protein
VKAVQSPHVQITLILSCLVRVERRAMMKVMPPVAFPMPTGFRGPKIRGPLKD